jgi:CubicO group peptidase (beta-lactamase class C family)
MSAIEASSGETFINYCRKRLFSPLLMDDTDFVRDDDAGRKPAVGHTVLGTPIESTVDGQWRAPIVTTTAPDMGRLIEAFSGGAATDESPERGGGPSPFTSIDESLRSMASTLDRLGYGVQVTRTMAGPCIDVADCRGGMGCLVRWYPQAGRGVAIMFNAETGPDAALRIAHLALGGR